MPRGFVFYNGPSLLDGTPIIGVATIVSKNIKTGNLIQTWILPRDVNPFEAIHNGQDESVCGDCPLRGFIQDGANKDRGCYVAVHNAPNNIWKSFHGKKYPVLASEFSELFQQRSLRYGAYGEPTAIPWNDWLLLEDMCTGPVTAGYTHQWRQERFQPWRKHLMASVHDDKSMKLAHSMGWRTFRTASSADDLTADEIFCPASPEGGERRNCETCGACNGNMVGTTPTRKSIFIIEHGGFGRLAGIRKLHERLAS